MGVLGDITAPSGYLCYIDAAECERRDEEIPHWPSRRIADNAPGRMEGRVETFPAESAAYNRDFAWSWRCFPVSADAPGGFEQAILRWSGFKIFG